MQLPYRGDAGIEGSEVMGFFALGKALAGARQPLWRAWGAAVRGYVRAGRAAYCPLALCILSLPAFATPQRILPPLLTSQYNDQKEVAIDLRSHWQAGLMSVGELPNAQALEPQTVWNWPDAKFGEPDSSTATGAAKAVTLLQNQRYVARIELASPSQGAGWNVSFSMPRLDAVHLAYRYEGEPWVQASAGDTLPMANWSFADRQPSFDIPQRPGKLSLVVDIAHRGVVDAPMLLHNAHTYSQQRMNASVSTGLLVGINLVMVVVGLLAALNFRRSSFLSISMMTLLMAAMVVTNSGIAGVYTFTSSAVFNDQSKFVSNTLLCVLFPWVTANVLSQRLYARWWWRVALAWAVVGSLMALWWMQYPLRDTAVRGVPVLALASTVLSFAMLVHARMRNHLPVTATALGVLLYGLALLAPLIAYLGHLPNDAGSLYASLAILAAALLFMYALVRQHRQGHMVLARAKTALGRDMLTGLLNRPGFAQALSRTTKRLEDDGATAAFFYVRVSDVQGLKERYGDEGFEVGMVQLAATLSSSIAGSDQVGRVAANAFAFTVLMSRDEKRATHIAQKILSRSLALANHGAPLVQTTRIAVAWLPTYGTLLPDIERRALRTLRNLENGKRIGWVGGVHAQSDSAYVSGSTSRPSGTSSVLPNSGVDSIQGQLDQHPTVPGVHATITQLEKDMLGPDSQSLRLPVKRRFPAPPLAAEQGATR
jgi:GGDEF domain-containing protein